MFERWLEIPTQRSCLIIGPRRSGKTTLLKQRYPEWPYATLDDLDYLEWAKRDPKALIRHLGQEAIIDEIQRLPMLTVAAKYAMDNENARFLMTGSSTLGLLDAAADSLAGRIDMISLPTACWGEELGGPTHSILDDRSPMPQIKEAGRRLSQAMTYGQFPEVVMQERDDDKQEILVNYRNTYFTRDLMQLSNIENLDGLLAVLQHLARSLGSHLDVSNFAREAGISHPTAKKYLNSLHQAQLTFKLYGYQFGPTKRYVKAVKTYFVDTGIIRSLNARVSTGQLLESFVLAELEKRRRLGIIRADQFCYYKSTGGHEIDLVFEADNRIYAIEIKSTQRPSPRDVNSLAQFSDRLNRPVRRYLFYLGDEYRTIENVQLLPVSALFRGK
ncbi:MAG: ATP-binding protein [Thermodesulfobacteriota bacterium]|nr:ATP-binding protein [Thermodesulfobacteriota bacterium]